MCKLKVDLTKVPKSQFKLQTSIDKQIKFYWSLPYHLDMEFCDASLKFTLRVGEKCYGAVEASFDDLDDEA